MSSENGEVYIMSPAEEGEWVTPTPAGTAITDVITDETDLEGEDVGDIDMYVDESALRAVLDGEEEELTFAVEDHDVTVTDDGDIRVD